MLRNNQTSLQSNQTKLQSQVPVSPKIKILLVDDQKIIQYKLQQVLSSQSNIQVVGTASDGEKAIALVEFLKPDVISIDIEMPKMNGIKATSIIKQRFPDCKVLVLSSHENQEYVQEIMAAGADGYVLKNTPIEDLITAINSVYKGYSYFGSKLLKKVQLADNTKKLSRLEPAKPTKIELKKKSDILPVPKKKYRSGAKFLVWSGFLAILAIGGWFGYSYYLRQPTEPITVSLMPVQKGDVEITVSESGTIELDGQQTLKSPGENATVEQVKVTEGKKVRAGETLLILRDRDAQAQEQDQELENTKNQLSLERSKEKVAEARQKVRNREAKVQESVELLERGFISESELEQDREQLDTTKSELSDVLVELKKAELDWQHGLDKLENIQQKLRDRLVTSPINGVVLDVQVKNGDGITTDTELLTLGDPEQEMVKLQLTTLNAAKVNLNQVARVSVIGPNPQLFMGRVISLSPQATTDSNNSSSFGGRSGNQAKVDALVVLDKPSETLIPGSQVNVEIVLEQRKNVVTLPLEALQNTDPQPFVWVKDAKGQAKKQPVTLGLEGLRLVEVTSGLQAGEQIVLPSPDQPLTPGTPLQTNP